MQLNPNRVHFIMADWRAHACAHSVLTHLCYFAMVGGPRWLMSVPPAVRSRVRRDCGGAV